MDSLSAYQRLRKRNVDENSQFLINHGLQVPVLESEESPPKKRVTFRIPKKKRSPSEKRFSLRIRLKVDDGASERDYSNHSDDIHDDDDADDGDHLNNDDELLKNLSLPNYKIARIPRPNSYGYIKGIKVGTWWQSRLDCNYDGIHRPTVAGIHPGPEGAYSVALSGGYEDDVDDGDSFTYTGEGGRDLKGTANNPKNLRTAPQSKHQTLERGNLALSRNVETGQPVRVIRGYKLKSRFAPVQGYRYDGLYQVIRCWEAVGKAGYRVYKFEFCRIDPEPAPWHLSDVLSSAENTEVAENLLGSGDAKPSKSSDTSDNMLQTSPKSPNQDAERKTMYFQLSPGKKSPIKVPNTLESLTACSVEVPSIDLGWQGWGNDCVLPRSDCFSVECEGKVKQVCIAGDEWKSMLYSLLRSCTPLVSHASNEDTLDNLISLPVKPNAVNPSSVSLTIEPGDNPKDSVCLPPESGEEKCQSEIIHTPLKVNTLHVKYEGNVVRVCWRNGKYEEINNSSFCDNLCSCAGFSDLYDWLGWSVGDTSDSTS